MAGLFWLVDHASRDAISEIFQQDWSKRAENPLGTLNFAFGILGYLGNRNYFLDPFTHTTGLERFKLGSFGCTIFILFTFFEYVKNRNLQVSL